MKRKVISTFLAIMLIFMVTIPAFATSAQEKKDQLEDQLKDAKDEKKEITQEKNAVLNEIDKLDGQIGEYEAQINKLNSKIKNLEKSITSKEKEITELEEESEEKQEALIQKLVAMYEAGQTTYLDVLLSSDSIVNFISNYYMMEQLAEADQAIIDSIEKKQKEIEQTKKELEQEKSEIKTSKKEVETNNNKLIVAKQSKQNKVNSLSKTEKKLQAKIDEFNAAIKKADEEIKEALKDSEGYQGSFSGTLSWPISTSSSYWNLITSGYGHRDSPTAGASTSHKALDIGISYKTIYAPADGYIVTASPASGYGNFIMIKHSNNLYTCYGHLSSYKVKAGQTVKRGQAIAVSGNTGISTGPHLHWEVRTSSSYNSRVNPLNYISDSVYSKLIFW